VGVDSNENDIVKLLALTAAKIGKQKMKKSAFG